MYCISITTLALLCYCCCHPVVAITTPPADWVQGLRESVHQALLREHRANSELHHQILSAPILGHRSNPPPFGDIVVLGRGQFYATPHGFKFVLDSSEACTGCHGDRCKRSYCQPWKNLGPKKLLALWTVKKIRHHDAKGHFYEIEYTISPITHLIGDDLVIQAGGFNYNIPGHIFVSKLGPAHEDHHVNNVGDTHKQVLHKYPGFYTSFHDHTTTDPKEYELYKKLIESLAAKTTHRFEKPPTKPTVYQQVPPETTYFQLVPVVTSPVNIAPPITTATYSEPDRFQNRLPTIMEPPKPITMPVTTVHYYAPVEKTSTSTKATVMEPDYDLFGDKTSAQLAPPQEPLPQTTVPYTVGTLKPSTTKGTQPTVRTTKQTPVKTTFFIPVTEEQVSSTRTSTMFEQQAPSTTTVFVPETTASRTTILIPTTHRITPTTYLPSTSTKHGTTTQFIPTIFSTQPAGTSNKPATTTITEFYFDATTRKPIVTTYTVPVTTTFTAKTTVPNTGTTYKIPITTPFNPETTAQVLPQVTTQHFGTTGVVTVPGSTTTSTTTTRQPDNFLVDTDGKPSAVLLNRNKEVSNDDIFGPEVPTQLRQTTQTSTTRKITQSDIAEALFGMMRKSKQVPLESSVTEQPKIIFTNFYAASTDSPGTTYIDTTNGIIVETTQNHPSTDQSHLSTDQNHQSTDQSLPSTDQSLPSTNHNLPSTDQSISTSVTFEVNKKNHTIETLLLEKPKEAHVQEILNHTDSTFKIYKAEDPGTEQTTLLVPITTPKIEDEVQKKEETRKVLDDFALQLVNHAKGIDYLAKKNARQAKYRRRSYTGRNRMNRTRKTDATKVNE